MIRRPRRASLLAATAGVAVMLSGCTSAGGTATHEAVPGAVGTPPPTTAPASSEAASRPFCDKAGEAAQRLLAVTRSGAADTEQARALLRTAQEAMGSLAALAPADIKPDAAVMVRAYADLRKEMEKADFDASKLAASSAGNSMSEPEVRTASTRLDSYYRTVCGLNVG